MEGMAESRLHEYRCSWRLRNGLLGILLVLGVRYSGGRVGHLQMRIDSVHLEESVGRYYSSGGDHKQNAYFVYFDTKFIASALDGHLLILSLFFESFTSCLIHWRECF